MTDPAERLGEDAVDSFTGNCVGTGIKPQSQHPDPELRKQIQTLWLRWTDEADADGLVDFYGLQALVCREVMEAGECLVADCGRGYRRMAFRSRSRFRESSREQLPAWYTLIAPNGNVIRAGIEFNAIGKRVTYHLLNASTATRRTRCSQPKLFRFRLTTSGTCSIRFGSGNCVGSLGSRRCW